MPVITLTQAKPLMGITYSDTSKDDFINALLPLVQRDIIGYCNNDFRDKNAPIYTPSGLLNYPKESIYNYQTIVYPIGFVFSSGLTFANNQITDLSNGFIRAGFYPGMDVVVQGSLHNDWIYLIDPSSTISAGLITLRLEQGMNSLVPEVSGRFVMLVKVKFPIELQLIAVQMIRFFLEKSTGTGKTSESLGDYHVGYSGTDYPQSILRSLNRFRKMKS